MKNPLARSSARVTAALATAALLGGTASAQASALIREGDDLAGAPAGHVVTSISNTAVNQVGGYAATLNSSDGGDSLSHVWGEATDAGAPALLRTETTVGDLQQNSFESFFGISDAGEAAYSPSCEDLVGGGTGLDCLFVDDLAVAVEDEPIVSLPGKIWRFNSRPGSLADGTPYWVGGINDELSGASEGNGLFLGTGATPLIKTGDILPPLADVLSSSGVDFDARVSSGGSHWVTKVTTDGATTGFDEFVVYDGSVYSIGGDLVGEGELIPAASGGNGVDAWDNFDFFGATEGGTVMFTGDTDGDTATDEFITRDGVIVYREGDTVDGYVLTGSIEGAFMNEAGQIAYVWDVEEGGGDIEALGFEDKILAVEGDEVDWDGDGFVDAGHVITGFTGLSAMTLGGDTALYFTADVDVPSEGELEGFFRLRYGCLDADRWSISMTTGGTQTLDYDAGAASSGSMYGLVGSMSGTSPGFTLAGVDIPLNPDTYFVDTVQQANAGGYVNTFGMLDGDGRATIELVVPADPTLIGMRAHHAVIAFGVGPLSVAKASAAVSIVLQP